MRKLYTIHTDKVMSLDTAVLLGLPFTTYQTPFLDATASAAKILRSEEDGVYEIYYRRLIGRSWLLDWRAHRYELDAAFGQSILHLVTFSDEEEPAP